MKSGRIAIYCACCIIMLISVSSASAGVSPVTYSGSLSTADGGLEGTGDWINSGGSSISWWITDFGSHWHYKYTLSVPDKDISHFIIEVSPGFGAADYDNVVGNYGVIEIQTFDQGNDNPDIPENMQGMKFDETAVLAWTIEFDSIRMPVWGDFYAKGGREAAIWNAGFGDDPTSAVTNGSLQNKLIRPDSTIVPEPTTVALLAMGLAAMVARRKALLSIV